MVRQGNEEDTTRSTNVMGFRIGGMAIRRMFQRLTFRAFDVIFINIMEDVLVVGIIIIVMDNDFGVVRRIFMDDRIVENRVFAVLEVPYILHEVLKIWVILRIDLLLRVRIAVAQTDTIVQALRDYFRVCSRVKVLRFV